MADKQKKKISLDKARRGDAPSESKASQPSNERVQGEMAQPQTMANYIVPAVLGLAVVGVIAYWARTNASPPEPASVRNDEGPSRSTEGLTEPSRAGGFVLPSPQPAPPGADQPVEARFPTPTSPDPRGGRFTLEDATEGLGPGSSLVAEIETNYGTFRCDLWPDRAPNTVANFVGLARGKREFWDPSTGQWTRRPYYNGTIFHRVIPGFMIQGGDILRSGRGGPGYEFADENVSNHDEAGLLCMANHGPNTNGSQFFILEEPKSHLNSSYSVFGRCSPIELVRAIARVPRSREDRPYSAVVIREIRIHR